MALKLVAICLVLVVSCTAQQFYTNTHYGKRDDFHSVDKAVYGSVRQGRSDAKVDVAARNDRFFLGSRYGKRSNEIQSPEQNVGRKLSEFSGNDGFFFGSRYGKRSLNTPFDYEFTTAEPDEDLKEKYQMNCVFTGIGALFNCSPKIRDAKTSELLL